MSADLPGIPSRAITWTIREATRDDLETVVEMRMLMGDELAPEQTQHLTEAEVGVRRAHALEGNRTYHEEHLGRDMTAWLAESGGRPVGSAAVYWFRHPPSTMRPAGLEAYILNVYVRPEFRRLGIARSLMETAVASAQAAGAERVWLRASENGRPLYESMGFRQKNYLELTKGEP